jgi:hypothetical protein
VEELQAYSPVSETSFHAANRRAAVGNYKAHNDMLRAGKVDASTGFGLFIASAVKLAVAFTMVGVFVASLLTHLTHPCKRHKHYSQIKFCV